MISMHKIFAKACEYAAKSHHPNVLLCAADIYKTLAQSELLTSLQLMTPAGILDVYQSPNLPLGAWAIGRLEHQIEIDEEESC